MVRNAKICLLPRRKDIELYFVEKLMTKKSPKDRFILDDASLLKDFLEHVWFCLN